MNSSRIIIVGGSTGIGFAVAQRALQAGYQVVVASSNAEKSASAVTRLGKQVQSECVDVSDEQSVTGFFARVGTFDHLVATPGSSTPAKPVSETSQPEVEHLFRVKFWGQYLLAKHAASRLPEHGSLTLTSGVLSRRPARGRGALAAVNAGVEALVRTLALELSPRRVNVVCPGFVDTGKMYPDLPPEARTAKLQAETGESLPTRRVGQPEDLAAAYLYAVENPYLTGQTLVVDGGSSIN